jgi:hypothetical protein
MCDGLMSRLATRAGREARNAPLCPSLTLLRLASASFAPPPSSDALTCFSNLSINSCASEAWTLNSGWNALEKKGEKGVAVVEGVKRVRSSYNAKGVSGRSKTKRGQ